MDKKYKLNKSVHIDKYLFALILLISIISIVIYRKYIFDGYYFISSSNSDIIRSNVPTYYQMYDAIKEGGYFWSWNMGIGTSMFSHADSYFDPFVYLLFIFGKKYILNMLVYMMIIKLIFQGIASYVYLSYFKYNKIAIVVASLFYSFSGYTVIMGSNFALGTICIYFPLILLGVEKCLKEDKTLLLFISLFLTCILSYYYFYISAICLAIYVLYRMLLNKKIRISKLFAFLKIGVSVVICSSFVWLPQIELVFKSIRVTNSSTYNVINLFVPDLNTILTFLSRLTSNDVLGNNISNSYYGLVFNSNDYFQNSQFFGSVFLYFYFVLYEGKERKEKKRIILSTLLLILAISLPIVSYTFNAFKMLTLRWLYVVSIIQTIVVTKAINKMVLDGKIIYVSAFIKALFSTVIIMFLSVIYISVKNNYLEMLSTVGYTVFIFILHIVSIYITIILIDLVSKKYANNKKIYLTIGCLIFVIAFAFDYSFNYYSFLQSNDILVTYLEDNNVDYLDNSATIISEILPNNDEFYRINKSFDSVVICGIASENDAMVQGYYGLKNYNSLPNSYYEIFLQNVDCYVCCPSSIQYCKEHGILPKEIYGQSLNYIPGVENRYNLMTFLGVKYYLSKENNENVPNYFKLISNINGINLYKNEYYMPLLFCNDSYITEDNFAKLSSEDKDIVLLNSTVLKSEDIFDSNSVLDLDDALNNILMKKQNCKIVSFSNDRIDVKFNATSEICSTLIPYDSNWKVYVDGNEAATRIVNVGFLGFDITKGEHEIEIVYEPKGFMVGVIISFIYIIIYFMIYCMKKINRKKLLNLKVN